MYSFCSLSPTSCIQCKKQDIGLTELLVCNSVAFLWFISFLKNSGTIYSILWWWFPYYVPFCVPVEIIFTYLPG